MGQGKLLPEENSPRGKLSRLVYTIFNLRATMRHSTQDNVILKTTHILSRVLAGEEQRIWIQRLGAEASAGAIADMLWKSQRRTN